MTSEAHGKYVYLLVPPADRCELVLRPQPDGHMVIDRKALDEMFMASDLTEPVLLFKILVRPPVVYQDGAS